MVIFARQTLEATNEGDGYAMYVICFRALPSLLLRGAALSVCISYGT